MQFDPIKSQDQHRIFAVLCPIDGVVRVWARFGAVVEDFTLAEAQDLCRCGDAALLHPEGAASGIAFMRLPPVVHVYGIVRPWLTVRRAWLVEFLRALRRALRAHEAARAMAPRGARHGRTVVIDDAARGGSDAGSWADALTWTGRGHLA